MIIEKLMRKCPFQSQTLRAVTGGALAAVIVSVAVVVLSSWPGLPTGPGIAAALAAVAGSSYVVGRRRT